MDRRNSLLGRNNVLLGDGRKLSAYKPTLGERVADQFRRMLYTDDRAGQRKAERVMDVLNVTPIGAALGVYDAGREAGMGNYGTAGLMLGMAAMPGPSPKKGIRAFHGSPHSFDKFDMSKIGTGEGAQVYGHGLYFAGNEDIAKGYRDALKHKGVIDLEGEAYSMGLPLSREAQIELRRQAAVDKNDPMRAAMWLQSASAQTRGMPQESLAELIDRYRDSQKGHMYEVNINADPNDFLDWDKPVPMGHPLRERVAELGMQGSGALNAADRNMAKDAFLAARNEQMTGAGLHNSLSRSLEANRDSLKSKYGEEALFAKPTELARRELLSAGIPGIKYLDAGSRVPSSMAKKELAEWQSQLTVAERELADAVARGDKWTISRKEAEVKRVQEGIARVSAEAEGTRNYVVFDDKLIEIVKKYGIAGASAMLGYNILANASPAQAQELKRIEGSQ